MKVYLVNSAYYNFNESVFLEYCKSNNFDELPAYFKRYKISEIRYHYICFKEHNFKSFLNTVSNCKIVLYNPIEPVTEFSLNFLEQIKDILESRNILLEIWLGNWDENYNRQLEKIHSNISLINWNRLVLYLSYNIYTTNKIKNTSFSKLFLNLNNKSRHHRCLLIDQLAKYNLLDYGNVSWLGTQGPDTTSSYDFQYFDGKERVLDTTNILSNHPTICKSIFEESFINLYGEYTESERDVIDISEKTWLSILYEKPFLAVASKGFYSKLESLGFQLYDDIFNYKFDNMSGIEERVHGIIDNLRNVRDLDYINLNEKIQKKIQYNKRLLLEIILKKDKLLDKWYSYTVQDQETNLIISKFKYNIKKRDVK